MAVIKVTSVEKTYAGVRVYFNTKLSEGQKDAGVVAKGTVVHPLFTTRVTLFKKNGIRVSAPSIKGSGGDWFNIVTLDQQFRNWIAEQYKESKKNLPVEPWYLEDEPEVPEVGEENLTLYTNLTNNQLKAGMICNATLHTDVGDLRGMSVFKSNYGDSLNLAVQTEDDEGKIPAFRLNRRAERQILQYLHSLVEWDEEPEIEEEDVSDAINKAVKAGRKSKAKKAEVVEEDFEEVEGMSEEEFLNA